MASLLTMKQSHYLVSDYNHSHTIHNNTKIIIITIIVIMLIIEVSLQITIMLKLSHKLNNSNNNIKVITMLLYPG